MAWKGVWMPSSYPQSIHPQTLVSRLRDFHMHLVSDATGETVIASARACVAQFDGVRPIEHFWNLVRTQRQLNLALEGISEKPGSSTRWLIVTCGKSSKAHAAACKCRASRCWIRS